MRKALEANHSGAVEGEVSSRTHTCASSAMMGDVYILENEMRERRMGSGDGR